MQHLSLTIMMIMQFPCPPATHLTINLQELKREKAQSLRVWHTSYPALLVVWCTIVILKDISSIGVA